MPTKSPRRRSSAASDRATYASHSELSVEIFIAACHYLRGAGILPAVASRQLEIPVILNSRVFRQDKARVKWFAACPFSRNRQLAICPTQFIVDLQYIRD